MMAAMNAEYTIKTELIDDVPPKRFTERGRFHYYIRVFIEAPHATLDSVDFVKYTLHPTFKDRYRVSFNRSKNFEIKLWSYGYFDVQASIVMKNGATAEASGYVEWRVPEGMPFDDDA